MPWKAVLCSKGSKDFLFFWWTIALRKIRKVGNLIKRNIILVNWYFMCKCNSETVDHLLICCVVASELPFVLSVFGF